MRVFAIWYVWSTSLISSYNMLFLNQFPLLMHCLSFLNRQSYQCICFVKIYVTHGIFQWLINSGRMLILMNPFFMSFIWTFYGQSYSFLCKGLDQRWYITSFAYAPRVWCRRNDKRILKLIFRPFVRQSKFVIKHCKYVPRHLMSLFNFRPIKLTSREFFILFPVKSPFSSVISRL